MRVRPKPWLPPPPMTPEQVENEGAKKIASLALSEDKKALEILTRVFKRLRFMVEIKPDARYNKCALCWNPIQKGEVRVVFSDSGFYCLGCLCARTILLREKRRTGIARRIESFLVKEHKRKVWCRY